MKKAVSCTVTSVMAVTSLTSTVIYTAAASPEEHISLTREAAADGMVLLENKGALPLKPQASVAMFGRAMIDYVRGGGGSGQTNVDYQVNILQGMQNKETEGKIQLYAPLTEFYTTEVTTNGHTNDADITVTDEMIDAAAAACPTAIMTIGRYSSEGSDRSATAGDYYLSEAEQDLITRLNAKFENVVVVLNVGAVMDTSWMEGLDHVTALLQSYQAGMEGGNAVADVLVGDVNPSGKTVDTYAKSYNDYPSSGIFNESNSYVNYEEDIFVGYRYFETFDPNYEKVNYEFGYGLSYTTFRLSDVNVQISGDDIIATVNVTNTGDRAGKEVVQTYFSAPQGKLGKPAKELAAFAKTDLLEPGESQTLEMSYAISDMSSYDDKGDVAKSAYVLEKGDYQVYVGNSIRNAGENGSVFTYTVDEDTITEQLSEQCAPVDLSRRLKADGTWEDYSAAHEEEKIYQIPAEGTTTVEMENFTSAHSTIRVEPFYDDDFNQKKCMAYMNAAGIWAEYTLVADQAGRYEVTPCHANGYADINDCLSVAVDGIYQPDIHYTAQQTGDGNGASEWYNFEEGEPFYINLHEGTNKVRFIAKSNNPNYDYMKLTRVGEAQSAFDKKVAAEGDSVIQAEKFNVSGMTTSNNPVRIENFTRDGEPASCLAYMNYVGNYVIYYLDVEQAGEYDVILNTANGRASFDFDPSIDVDGTTFSKTITAIQTGDGSGKSEWYNFEDLEPVTVTLPAGNTQMRFTCLEKDKYPNIDYITIRPHTAQAAAETAQNGMLKKAARVMTEETGEPQADEKIMLVDVYNNPELMDSFLAQLTDDQLINMMGGQTNTGVANTGGMGNLMEYGIPNAMTADGPQGIRIGVHCTAWPVSTLLASTWDTDLIYRVGKAAAKEAAANGIDIWLAPGMNIHRDPLCGRNFEYYSEDPLVAGKMAAAITKGCQSENVSITLKHFTVNNKETNRNSVDTRLSERALREIYLKGFEIAVKEADPWSIMTSYNFLNGIETSENYELLTNIVRGEWNWQGVFMTDWGNNSSHVRELRAGNDVKMPSGSPDALRTALERGVITRQNLEDSAERLVNMIMKTNIFQTKILNPTVVDIDDGTIFKAADNILWSETARGESTSDSDGGMNLGYCDAGAWTQYEINVLKGGTFDVSARMSGNSGDGGEFDLVIDGEIAGHFVGTNTGGWQNWVTRDPVEVHLPAGRHTMRIEFTVGGSNLNWLQFAAKTPDPETQANKTLLNQAIAYAQAIPEEDFENVNEVVLNYFNTALAEAIAVSEDAWASQEEVNEAWIKLSNAIQMLSFRSDKTRLNALIAEAEALSAENYPEALWTELQNALTAAKEVSESPTALDESITAAADALQTALDALYAYDELDLSVLEYLVEQVSMADHSKYLHDDNWTAFLAALSDANEVLALPEDQAAVNAAVVSLNGAWLNLRMKPDEALLAYLQDFSERAAVLSVELYSAPELQTIRSLKMRVDNALASRDLDQETAQALADEAKELEPLLERENNKPVITPSDEPEEKVDPADDPAKPADPQTKPSEEANKPSESEVKPADADKPAEKAETKDEEKNASVKPAKNSVKTAASVHAGWFAAAGAAALGILSVLKRRKK